MSQEKFPSYEQDEKDSFGPGERLEMYHTELRRRAKGFRILIERAPAELPNREKLIKISNEILDLVPVANQEEEDADEAEQELLMERARESARARMEKAE